MSFAASIITLFPEAFPGTLGVSLIGKALREGAWSLDTVNLREFGQGPHKNVDDTPAGGGAGMVLRADVAAAAIDHVMRNPPPLEGEGAGGGVIAGQGLANGNASPSTSSMRAFHPHPLPLPPPGGGELQQRPLIYPSPRGEPFSQAMAREWAAGPGLVLFCGRFEGLDERVIEARGLREIAVGDAVLAGGEAAALVILEACVRLLPGVLGNEHSAVEESFADGLLEYPHYTRPREWEGRAIPEQLLSGDHARIEAWRAAERERITAQRRPDLKRKRDGE